jgi:2-oxoisovalerate dehydrogenase E1 component beta subunit
MTGRDALRTELRAHVDAGGLLLGEAVGTHGLAAGIEGAGVRRTTLSENATVGEAAGAALTGARVVVELLDPMGYARAGEALADLSSLAPRSRGAWSAAVVVIAPWTPHARVVPGVDLHVVGTPEDAGSVLARAFGGGRPAVVLVHNDVLDGEVCAPAAASSGARVVRAGSRADDVVVLAAGPGVSVALAAAEDRDATVIDLRTLAPLDRGTLGEAVRAAGRVVVVELADLLVPVVEEGFLTLESPPALTRADAGEIAAAIDAVRAT